MPEITTNTLEISRARREFLGSLGLDAKRATAWIQYGYSEHGPYWEQDPYIFWDVLDPDEDPTVRIMIDEMKPTGDYDEHIKMLGLELNWAE